MPAATTAVHVVRPCAALAQRHAHAKQRRKRQRPVRSARHVALGWMIAKAAETGPITIGHKVTALIRIAHMRIARGPTVLLAIAPIALLVIAPSKIAHAFVMTTEARIVAETSGAVLTTAMVHAMTHVRIRVAQVATIAKIALDLIVLAPTLPINANAMSATPHKLRAHQPSRKSAVMTTARCVCPS